MKVSAVVLCSLLGMGASTATVTWLTPAADAAAPTAVTKASEIAAAEPAAPASETPAEPVAVTGLPAAPPTFTLDGPLRLDGRLGHAVLPGDRTNETYLMVEVGAPQQVAVDARAPVNLSIVIDRSGSMRGKRLDNAIAAARGMLARLRADDTVSVVAYHSQAELLVAPTRVDRLDRFSFERALTSLRGRGHTCISCGLDMARGQLGRRTDGINRILLLSDGVANRGLTSVADLRALGDQARREQTAVASIGVDVDYDERTLFALSQASNGHHYFVEDPSGLPAVFEREARNLVGTIADRVDVEVELAEGVEVLEVISRGHRREGNRIALSFGSFNAGDDRSALLRVRLDPGRGDRPVADVRLAYRDLAQGREREATGALGLALDPETSRIAQLDARVEERLGRRETLDALLTANEAFARGDLASAQRELAQAQGRISQRRTRSATTPTAAPEVARDFEEQLDALGKAQSVFEDAAKVAPSPKAASKSRQGKKAIRLNAEAANPFG